MATLGAEIGHSFIVVLEASVLSFFPLYVGQNYFFFLIFFLYY